MTNTEQDSTTQRSATRAPVDRPIHLQFDDSMDVVEGMCRNISIGGMFVKVEKTRPRGSLVRFELQVGDSSTIRGLGEVVWSRTQAAGAEREAGIGIKFRFLEQRDRQLIFKLVSQHIKERLARRQPAGAEVAGAPVAAEPPPAGTIDEAAAESMLTEAPSAQAPSAEAPPAEASPAETAPAEDPFAAVAPAAANVPVAEPAVAPAAAASEPFPELAHDPLPALDSEPGDLEAPAVSEPRVGSGGLPPEAAPAAVPAATVSDVDSHVSELAGGVDAAAIPTTASFLDSTSEPTVLPESRLEPGEEAAAFQSAYVDEVSDGKRRRRVTGPLVLALGMAALAAGLYLVREQLFETSDASPPPIAAAGEPAVDREPPAAGDIAPRDAGESDLGGAPAPDGPEVAERDEAASELQPAASPPAASVPPPPTLSTPPPAEAPAVELTRLVDIEWNPVPAGLEVVLVADGAVPAGRFRHFRLGGTSPREVIQLVGVDEPFERTAFAVGGPGVAQIRTGYHRKPGGDELHVVLDLTAPDVSVREIRSSGRRLTVVVEVP